jgi:hypothetical protein
MLTTPWPPTVCMKSLMFSIGSPKNLSPPWLSICSRPRWMAPTLAALTLPYWVVKSLALSPTYCEHGAQVLQVEQQQAVVVGDLEHQVQHAGLGVVEVQHAAQQQRAHVGDGGAHRVALLAEHVPQRDRAGVGVGQWQPRSFRMAAILLADAAGWLMPVRSPLTSAMNTGTPMREKLSARVCSVTVLPVPVAPVIRPWRLARPGSRWHSCRSVLGNQNRVGHGFPRGVRGKVKSGPID